MYRFTDYNGKEYITDTDKNMFILQDCENITKYWIKVEPSHEFVFKVMKTKIKAMNGAQGLEDFIKECYKEHILETRVDCIINAIKSGYIKSVHTVRG